MSNQKSCYVCIILKILEEALDIIPTASGVYLEFLLDTADACTTLLRQGGRHTCGKESQPPYSNTGVTSTPADTEKQNGMPK